MSRPKGTSPSITVTITDEMYETAKRSKSGACLIADAIRAQYPQFTNASADMAQIRFSDRSRGERYIYFTPQAAQEILLSFDQGHPRPVDTVVIRRAGQIVPIVRPRGAAKDAADRQRAAIDRIEGKVRAGTATSRDRRRLERLRDAINSVRPTSQGPKELVPGKAPGSRPSIVGGRPPRTGAGNPNLLRGTDRHFGAKLADPGLFFEQAVEAEVARRLAEQS